MPDDVIQQAEVAMAGITPGPWEMRKSDGWIKRANSIKPIIHAWEEGECAECEATYDRPVNLMIRPADAEFIAAAPTLVDELLAALGDARAAVARVRRICEGVPAANLADDAPIDVGASTIASVVLETLDGE